MNKKVFMYCNFTLIFTYEFISNTETVKYFSYNKMTINNYLKNKKYLKENGSYLHLKSKV